MSETPNKELVRSFFDVYTTQDYSSLSLCLAEDYFDHSLPQVRSIQDAIAILQSTHKSFPDIQVVIEDLIEEFDQVVFRGRFMATHKGEFLGLAPTGARIEFQAIEIFKIKSGRIAESWGYWPSNDIQRQIRQHLPQ